MRILSYRTTMPFSDGGDSSFHGISPETTKSIMPFNNVHTIQDVLNGRKYDSIHGGGDWSPGEDTEKNYREDGDSYKREERDLDIIKKMVPMFPIQGEQWKVKTQHGIKVFPSFSAAQKYQRQVEFLGDKCLYITRIAQNQNNIEDSLTKCVMVEAINPKEGVKETGSAFCIENNYFLTCAHVIKKYNKNKIEKFDTNGILINLVQNGIRHNCSLITFDLELDIALLKSDLLISPFEIDLEINAGDSIIAIGSPHGYDNNITKGIISSTNRSIYKYKGAPNYMFIDANVFPGNSGGPIIKESNGKMIGMVTLIIKSGEGNYGLNAALPSSYITNFLNNNNIKGVTL